MTYKSLSLGLGFCSIAIGVTELFASKRIAKALDTAGNEGLVMAFGVREIASGVMLLRSPANSIGVWGRAVGDGMDLAALALAAKNSPRNKVVWCGIAAAIGAGIIDAVVARGLGAEWGKDWG